MQVAAYDFQGAIPEILPRLEQARVSDDRAELLAKRYKIWFVVCLVFGLIGWFPLALVGAALDTTAPILLSPVSIVAAIALKVLELRARRFDLDDRRLDAALRVLRMLAADTAAGGSVRLRIDFRGYRAGGQQVAKTGGFFSSVKTAKYAQEWFELTGALVDGTRYQLAVTDVVSRKSRSKRKYTKVKERFRSQIALRVRLRPRHGGIEPVVSALQAAPPPPRLQRTGVTGTGQSLEVRFTTLGTNAVKGRYRTTPPDPARLVSGEVLLGVLLWTWDGIGRTLRATA